MKLGSVPGLVLLAAPALAQQPTVYLPLEKLPAAVRPFVARGTRPLALESADLNGDGLRDFILVLERQKARPSDPDIEERQRPLLILVGRRGGALKQVKRNDEIVLCSDCGGFLLDPFQGVRAGPKTFTVSHYDRGGGAFWSTNYTFRYSRRDDTWQLVRAEESSFQTGVSDKVETGIYTPPRHYGKIDIADFDPGNWRGRGRK